MKSADNRLSTQKQGSRLRIATMSCVLLLVLLAGRLVFIQGVDAAGEAERAMANRTRPVELMPERGSILDREGNVMAESVQRYDLIADQRLVKDFKVWDEKSKSEVKKDIDEELAKLAEILDMDEKQIRSLMLGDRPYRVITRGVTPEVREKAMKLKIPGLLAEQVSDRSYPNGAVAGNLLGFVGNEGNGLEGLELSQEEHLAGTPGQRVFEISADGVRIPNASFFEEPAIDGSDVKLTIDQDVSWYAQEAIAAKVDQFNAQWGNIVVMDAKTGEILAMADSTTVDPAQPGKTDSLFWRPTALTQSYEPGSTGKVLTFASALDQGTVKPTDKHRVPNKQEFDGEVINDSLPHATYDMTTAGIFTRSYNTGTVQVSETMDKKTRYDYMKKFGIGEKIDVGLPGANPGLLNSYKDWDRRQQFTTSFGQAYTVTSLHMTRVFQAVANDGVMMPPKLIDSYIDPDGTEHPHDAGKPQRVISKEASEEMLKLMEGVVESGTGSAAAVPGYRVGGKTGTGQAAGSKGGYDGYTSSFTAIAPLDDPQFIVSVAMYRPQGQWENFKVTDTAGDVMSYLLNRYSVAPSKSKSQSYDVFTEDPQERPW